MKNLKVFVAALTLPFLAFAGSKENLHLDCAQPATSKLVKYLDHELQLNRGYLASEKDAVQDLENLSNQAHSAAGLSGAILTGSTLGLGSFVSSADASSRFSVPDFQNDVPPVDLWRYRTVKDLDPAMHRRINALRERSMTVSRSLASAQEGIPDRWYSFGKDAAASTMTYREGHSEMKMVLWLNQQEMERYLAFLKRACK